MADDALRAPGLRACESRRTTAIAWTTPSGSTIWWCATCKIYHLTGDADACSAKLEIIGVAPLELLQDALKFDGARRQQPVGPAALGIGGIAR
jgi:hypothetical protein